MGIVMSFWRENHDDSWFEAMNTPVFVCDLCGLTIEVPNTGCLAWRNDTDSSQVSAHGMEFIPAARVSMHDTLFLHWPCYEKIQINNDFLYAHQEIGESVRYLTRNMNLAYSANMKKNAEEEGWKSSSPRDWHVWNEEMGIPIGKRVRRTFNATERAYIRERAGGVCFYCQGPLGDSWHIDHMIPISKGGENEMGNLTAACKECNSEKRDATHHEYMALLDARSGRP